MEQKRQGALVYDQRSGRYDIRFTLTEYYGGIHCGECMDVMVKGRWVPTCMEMAEDWYLVGIGTTDLAGLRVRI